MKYKVFNMRGATSLAYLKRERFIRPRKNYSEETKKMIIEYLDTHPYSSTVDVYNAVGAHCTYRNFNRLLSELENDKRVKSYYSHSDGFQKYHALERGVLCTE